MQPLAGQQLLALGNRLLNADRIEKTGQNNAAGSGADPIIQMQAAAYVTDMPFDIPDSFAAAAPAAKQRQVVTVTLRMVAGNQA